MLKFIVRVMPVILVAAFFACSNDGGGTAEDADAVESPGDDPVDLQPDGEIEEGEALETPQDTPGDLPQDDVEESDMPWGMVKPRCGDSLVSSCADCPDRPYVCSPCELDAICVADCGAGCGGAIACPGTGECMDPGMECTTAIFCGCAPPLKTCQQGETVTCLDDCTGCTGMPGNFYGVCSDFPAALGACPDEEGPEYFCQGYYPDNTGICTTSCADCGDTYCLNSSCAGQSCESGNLPDYPFYTCGRQFCCETGFLCPATSGCVASCSECTGAAAGACGENGVCVASCDECFEGATGELDIQVCDGRCVDLFTDQWHCGACGTPCMGSGMDRAQCSMGHCCIGSLSEIPPWTWCDDCSCCLSMGFTCNASACEYGCVGSP